MGFELEQEKKNFHSERINYMFYMQMPKLKISLYLTVEIGIRFSLNKIQLERVKGLPRLFRMGSSLQTDEALLKF